MGMDASKALQLETEFLSGVDSNLERAKGVDLKGSHWRRSDDDESDRLRALLAQNRDYDRDKLKSIPSNRRIVLRGFARKLFFWRKRTGVAIASVLSPLEAFAKGGQGDPIGLGELADHVRKLLTDRTSPHLVGVCSPTGFTPEARQAKLDSANATVVLIEPNGEGGWTTTANGDNVDPRILQLFDPEGSKQKVERVRQMIADHSTDLLTGGLSVSQLAAEANLPEKIVQEGFERVAEDDPELRVAQKNGEFLLYRGAAQQPGGKRSMNMIERVRRLFSGEGNETEKINVLSERRAALAQRRDRIYDDITKLEKKESSLVVEGKAATSSVPRRRIAAQVAQLRKDIARHNTTAGMLNQQINIISTDIHNLTLIQQGEIAQLPDTEELTENAVKAEEMLETLKVDAELVGNLETGMEEALVSEEELAVLKEFEADDAKQRPSTPAADSAPAAQPPQQTTTPQQPRSPGEQRAQDSSRKGSSGPEHTGSERDQAGPEAL